MRVKNRCGGTHFVSFSRNDDFEVDCPGYHLHASLPVENFTNHLHVSNRCGTKKDCCFGSAGHLFNCKQEPADFLRTYSSFMCVSYAVVEGGGK